MPYTEREMEVYAELLEEELEAIDSVSSVTAYGLQDERVFVEVASGRVLVRRAKGTPASEDGNEV